MKTSVLLLTLNEAENLPRCLDGLAWCDDIVLLDSGSTDQTISIAKSRGARVLYRAFDNFAAQRNHGLQFAGFRHDWVLHLDADEVVTPEFARCLEALTPREDVDGFRVPSKLMLFGQWLRRAGMYPVYQVRLGRRDVLRFKQVGHGQRETLPADRLATFPEPYLHYSFSAGMRPWLEKHIRYANDEAIALLEERQNAQLSIRALASRDALMRRRAIKVISSKIPLSLRPSIQFIHVYFACGGFLDRSAGLTYSLLLAVYEGMIAAIAWEMQYDRDHTNERKLSRRLE